MNRSVTIRAAWIGGIFVLVAALIGGVFTFCSPNKKTASQITDSPKVTVSGQSGNITINYNIPETKTREAIAALEKKVDDTNSAMSLTRDEVHLLAQALRDLDQRTSGIKKLPDGRTQMGGFIAGNPTITVQEHQAAQEAYMKGDYKTALEHSREAIRVHEESSNAGGSLAAGVMLGPEDVSKLYYLGSLSAGASNNPQLALEWAKKADAIYPRPEYKAVEVAALSDLGRKDEAGTLLGDALKSDPNNEQLLKVKAVTRL